MMSAIFSGVIGAIGGIVTPIIQHKQRIEEEEMKHTHEIDRMKVETEMQDKLMNLKIQENKIKQITDNNRNNAEINMVKLYTNRDSLVSSDQLMMSSYKAFGTKNKRYLLCI